PRQYKCRICARSLTTRASLKRHGATHSKERPHSCNICHKRFQRGDKCKRHYLT
ncbi:hypothetical protein K469DRAFT_493460, partial [Zopfia rhizophila CBS 207.26]